MPWRYAKDSVRFKVRARGLSDRMITRVLDSPDLVTKGHKGRSIAQKTARRRGFGNLLIRVVYEQVNDLKLVVTAYWARSERYEKGRQV